MFFLVALLALVAISGFVDLTRRGHPVWAVAVVAMTPFAPLAALVAWVAVATVSARVRAQAR
jgi:hypothetical protein